MTLTEMAKEYEALLARKEALEQESRQNEKAITDFKEKFMQAMVDEDMPSFSTNDGRTYTITAKTRYSKISDEALTAGGLDFFGTLREEGLGDLIKETVNANTLNAAIRNYVEEHETLSASLAAVIRTYDYNDLSRTTKKKGK